MSHVLRSIARSPFVQGFARSVDLFGTFNRPSPYRRFTDPKVADARAFESDWDAVGKDIRSTVEQMKRENAAV